MKKVVVIDSLPESVWRYRVGWAIVAVDVIRATTTAVTAAAAGWRCYPAPTIESGIAFARNLTNPILAGESGGSKPPNFEMDNSPAELLDRSDTLRPLVLVSSSGTKLIHRAGGSEAVYLSCFRNYSTSADYLARRHSRVAVIGAGSLGEFREEDQACCAWVAARLLNQGFDSYDVNTTGIVSRWSDKKPEDCLGSRSVGFLRRTDRLRDLDFIFSHIDDLSAAFGVHNGEVQVLQEQQAASTEGSPVLADYGEGR